MSGRTWVLATWTTVATLSACGGASTATPSSTASSGGPAASSGASPSGLPSATAADRGLSAFALLDAAGYRAALGEDVMGPEDDGGFPSSPGHVSATRIVTAKNDVVLSVTLSSLDTKQAAQQVFASQSGGSPPPSPLPGVGDQAVQSGGMVLVLRGAQVLVVSARTGAAAQKRLDDIKIAGGDPGPAYAQLLGTANTLAPVLATHLTGQASTAPVLALPAGGVDPCISQDAASNLFPKATPTVSHQPSEKPPATQCSIQLRGGSIMIQVVSDQQLTNAIAPTSSAKLLAADLAAHQGLSAHAQPGFAQPPGGGTVQDLAPMKGFYATSPEADLETVIGTCLFRLTLPGSHNFTGDDAYDRAYLAKIIDDYLKSRAIGDHLQRCATRDEIQAQLRDLDNLRNGGGLNAEQAAFLAAAMAALMGL